MDFYRRNDLNRPNWLEQGFSGWCAMRIQAWYETNLYLVNLLTHTNFCRWRMLFTRRMYITKRFGGVVVNIAAITIQCLYRAILYRRYKAKIEYSNRVTFAYSIPISLILTL